MSGSPSAAAETDGGRRLHPVLSRWPAALGLAFAGLQLATGATLYAAAITLAVALLCYLGAAALRRPWVAWAGVPGGSLVVVATVLLGLPWWAGLAVVAVILVIIGLIAGVSKPPLTAQILALLGFGAAAMISLLVAPQVGMVLAGAALASHAVWDAIHYRRNQVVPRSLAEFCMALDLLLGGTVVILAFV